jgi:predicted acetyltransferase
LPFHLFFEVSEQGYNIILLLEFCYDRETDWYETTVVWGDDIVGYLHGYANQGWAPQVNNIWVAERFRRRGIGSRMMAKVGEILGQIPLPATPIKDNRAAKAFWKRFITQYQGASREKDRSRDGPR